MARFVRKNMLVIAITAVMMIGMASDMAMGQINRKKKTENYAVKEDDRSWAGFPWLAGGLLSAGAMMVGLKNAKRSHLD